MKIDVNVNMLRLQERFDMLLFAGGVPGMTVAIVDETLDELRNVAVNEVAGRFTCSRPEIDARVARSKSYRETKRTAEGAVYLTSKRIPLRRFFTRQVEKGVLVRPYTSGRSRVIRGAFGPNVRRLGGGVFRRKGKARTPIEREPGINLRKDRMAADGMRAAQSQLNGILDEKTRKHVAILLDGFTRGVTVYEPTYMRRFTEDKRERRRYLREVNL